VRKENIVITSNDFQLGFMLTEFAVLGAILVGTLLSAHRLERWHPRLVGAVIGAVFGVLAGVAIIEAVPLLA
jgi:hypothetical protein